MLTSNLPYTDESDSKETGSLTLSGSIDISNIFRESLNSCIKLLV